jgi:polyisoprenoid-binding protein YceI
MECYAVVARQSRLVLKVSAGGLLSAFGHNPKIVLRDLRGEVWFAPDAPEQTKVKLAVSLNALEVTGDVKTSDRREIEKNTKEDVLEVDRFPDAFFESASVSRWNNGGGGMFEVAVDGQLTLHGQTETTSIAAHVSRLGESLRVRGAFQVSQREFGIRPPSLAGGALKVKDDVEVEFEVVAQRRREPAPPPHVEQVREGLRG